MKNIVSSEGVLQSTAKERKLVQFMVGRKCRKHMKDKSSSASVSLQSESTIHYSTIVIRVVIL